VRGLTRSHLHLLQATRAVRPSPRRSESETRPAHNEHGLISRGRREGTEGGADGLVRRRRWAARPF